MDKQDKMRTVINKVLLLGTLLLAAAIFAVAGVAYASIPNNGVITACYGKSGGALRVIDSTVTDCKSKETKLEWNLTGPAGQAGQDGVSGYEIVTNDKPFGDVNFDFGSVSVDCPVGKKVLGGGGAFVDSDGNRIETSNTQIRTSAPKADGGGWSVGYELTSAPFGGVVAARVYATCATVQ